MTVEFSSSMGVELIEVWGSDRKIAQAARVSTKGLDNDRGRVSGLVNALWRDGHYSPFEHSGMTIALDVPLFVRDQIVRHKSMSFSVLSGRYTELPPKFYVPGADRPLVQVGKALDYRREPGGEFLHTTSDAFHESVAEDALDKYRFLIKAGVANEVARNVLPASVYTQMWVSGTLRSWLHFLDQRADKHAQHETQDVAEQIKHLVGDKFPLTYQAWEDHR